MAVLHPATQTLAAASRVVRLACLLVGVRAEVEPAGARVVEQECRYMKRVRAESACATEQSLEGAQVSVLVEVRLPRVCEPHAVAAILPSSVNSDLAGL
eukprot:2897669-Prymnesium_polylepis.1